MLTLGSGVGGAYAVRGKIKADESNDYARFGHLPVEKDGVLCNCGRRGCAEQYLSGRAINRMAAKEGIGTDKLFEEYASGNPIAQKIVTK
ncbi:MAG: ROK family protein [Clostridiales bacterium]|nr:ROK family protein [Clostridiales bacterium]